MKKQNVLVVAPTKVGLTETFIRAHIDRLDANITHIYGYYLDYFTDNDLSLTDVYHKKQSFLQKLRTLLPHFIFFRIQQQERKKQSPEELIKRFIIENKIDVVLAEYGTAGSFITPICQSLTIPLIVHFHGFDASRYKTLDVFKDGYQKMFNYATKVIVVSRAMKKALLKQGCPEKKIIINTYGPHPDYFDKNPDYKSNHIVAVGRHTYKKAPYLTILAFQEVLKVYPNLTLTLIGSGELYEVCDHMVKSLGLEDSINLPGALERDKIIGYLKKSCLFIQHSLVASDGDSEGTPIGIIEAMAVGLPIVSTRHAGIMDVVIENKTGFLVDEGDIVGMANYILQLVQDRNLAHTLGVNGKSHIKENFSMERHIKVLNSLIKAI